MRRCMPTPCFACCRESRDGKFATMKKNAPSKTDSPSRLIDARIKELGDWHGAMLARIDGRIKKAAPNVDDARKRRGTPVRTKDATIWTGGACKAVQMVPSCDHSGMPRHFHSSTTSGSACLMRPHDG